MYYRMRERDLAISEDYRSFWHNLINMYTVASTLARTNDWIDVIEEPTDILRMRFCR